MFVSKILRGGRALQSPINFTHVSKLDTNTRCAWEFHQGEIPRNQLSFTAKFVNLL